MELKEDKRRGDGGHLSIQWNVYRTRSLASGAPAKCELSCWTQATGQGLVILPYTEDLLAMEPRPLFGCAVCGHRVETAREFFTATYMSAEYGRIEIGSPHGYIPPDFHPGRRYAHSSHELGSRSKEVAGFLPFGSCSPLEAVHQRPKSRSRHLLAHVCICHAPASALVGLKSLSASGRKVFVAWYGTSHPEDEEGALSTLEKLLNRSRICVQHETLFIALRYIEDNEMPLFSDRLRQGLGYSLHGLVPPAKMEAFSLVLASIPLLAPANLFSLRILALSTRYMQLQPAERKGEIIRAATNTLYSTAPADIVDLVKKFSLIEFGTNPLRVDAKSGRAILDAPLLLRGGAKLDTPLGVMTNSISFASPPFYAPLDLPGRREDPTTLTYSVRTYETVCKSAAIAREAENVGGMLFWYDDIHSDPVVDILADVSIAAIAHNRGAFGRDRGNRKAVALPVKGGKPLGHVRRGGMSLVELKSINTSLL